MGVVTEEEGIIIGGAPMKKIAVFASGNGSNFQAIIDVVQTGELKADIALLVCDKPGAFAIERANAPVSRLFLLIQRNYSSKEAYEKVITEQLTRLWCRIYRACRLHEAIGPTLLGEYSGRIVNIHPSLLPAFPGKDAIGQALAAREKWTGVTIHYVDEGMDTGPIIVQERVS